MPPFIRDRLAAVKPGETSVSFEFFPPRTDKGEEDLLNVNVPKFVQQSPIFLDMTWGAGGSTSEKTMRLCRQIQDSNPDVPVNMHITCTNMPKGLISEALDFAKAHNIRNIVALRGDPPAGEEFKANEDGFACALDLVRYIRSLYGDYFCITVAGYPEGHPSKLDAEGKISEEDYTKELEYLKLKVDAGADLVITQLFYDANLFIRFVKRCREIGIKVPILPGLLPATTYPSLMRMVQLSKTYMPDDMKAKVEELKDSPDEFKAYGVAQNVQMARDIIAANIGVSHFHFYTINSTEQTFNVMKQLGVYKE